MDVEQRLHLVIQDVANIKARQSAADAVLLGLVAVILHANELDAVVSSVRESLSVTVKSTDLHDAQVMKLMTEQCLDDVSFQLERILARLRRD